MNVSKGCVSNASGSQQTVFESATRRRITKAGIYVLAVEEMRSASLSSQRGTRVKTTGTNTEVTQRSAQRLF